jgi:hypothetical protein
MEFVKEYPAEIVCYGKTLKAIGIGKYPYDCISKDKYPNAMIYWSKEAGWTALQVK